MQPYKKQNIVLRKGTLNDAGMMLDWRNSEEVRHCSLNKKIISAEEHINWLTKVLNDNKIFLLIAECDSKPIGVLRYDVIDSTALVSIYLRPGESSKGLGSSILQFGANWLQQNISNIDRIEAKIISDNIASIKAFEKAGFESEYAIYSKVILKK